MFRVRPGGAGICHGDHWQRSEKVANYSGGFGKHPNLKYTAPGHFLTSLQEEGSEEGREVVTFVSGKNRAKNGMQGFKWTPSKASDPWEMGPTE